MKSPDEYAKAIVGGLVAAGGAFVSAYETHQAPANQVVLTLVAFAVAFGAVYATAVVKEAVAAIVAGGAAFTGSFHHATLAVTVVTTVVALLAGFAATRWTDNSSPIKA